MRLIQMRSDGTAKGEHLFKLRQPIIEIDGDMYPVTHEAVFTHRHHVLPPLAIVWQGLTDWEGIEPSVTRTAAQMKQIEMSKQHNQSVRISKHWVRKFLYGAELFLKVLATSYLIGFTILLGWFVSL